MIKLEDFRKNLWGDLMIAAIVVSFIILIVMSIVQFNLH